MYLFIPEPNSGRNSSVFPTTLSTWFVLQFKSSFVLPCLASWLALILPPPPQKRAKLLALLRIQVQVADGLLVVYVPYRYIHLRSQSLLWSPVLSFSFSPETQKTLPHYSIHSPAHHLFHVFPWTLLYHFDTHYPSRAFPSLRATRFSSIIRHRGLNTSALDYYQQALLCLTSVQVLVFASI